MFSDLTSLDMEYEFYESRSISRHDESGAMEVESTYVGGYYCQFVDSRKELATYRCAICLQVAREAHEVSCCKKIFCLECLQKHFFYKSPFTSCPHCREESCSYTKRTDIDQAIQSTKVRCSNDGCTWTGQISNFEVHSTKTCKVKLISCPYCKQSIQRQQLHHHKDHECQCRSYQCPYCGEFDEYHKIMEHIATECPEAPIECSNGMCSAKVKRKEMESHQHQCRRQSIPCAHAELIDCKEFVIREEMHTHEKDSLCKHFELAMASVRHLQAQMNCSDEVKESLITRVPVTFKIDNFAARKSSNNVWWSRPFYTHPRGYKVCLRVHTNGASTGKGSHISVYLLLMPGPFDQELQWPFLCIFKVAILNQLENTGHVKRKFKFINDRQQCGDKYNQCVPCCKETADIGIGEPQFIPHALLEGKGKCQCAYLKDDCIFVSVRSANVSSVPQSWLTTIGQSCDQS